MPCLLDLQRYTKNLWGKTPVVKVDNLPFDINGEAVYQVPYQKDKRMKAIADGRPWDRDMPIKWRGAEKGSVSAQRCRGSCECKNPKFSFKQQHGKANKVQFEKNRDGDVVCKNCWRCSIFVSCLARKYMEFLAHVCKVRVCQIGTHTCQAKRKVPLPSVVEQSLRREPKFETIRGSEAVDFGRPEGRRCGLGWPGENNGLSPRHKEDFKPES